jgi:3-oxoacyl-[acyl-carrier-protein] synthase II
MGPAVSAPGRRGRTARDALVTGMGFCLPGQQGPVITADQLWDVASTGTSCLRWVGGYYGLTDLTEQAFTKRLPGLAGFIADNLNDTHRLGLVSLYEACADAKLELEAGELAEAAILVGRGGIDSNVTSYLALRDADLSRVTSATEMFVRAELGISTSDVGLVQSAVARSTGPCFTVACGCSSASVQLGHARELIANGTVDIAVVTGVDVLSLEMLQRAQGLVRMVLGEAASFDHLMRPYDRRGIAVNHGEGSATLVLESREHAERRGSRSYGQIVSTALTRSGLLHPLASDDTGGGLASAIRTCLADEWRAEEIRYIHGGNDGGPATVESNAIRELYGNAASPLVSSQEACFGHNGAPIGALGVALTLLMMEHREVCPTANCEQPDPDLPFDPVPGTVTRPLDFDYGLTVSYQIGGVQSAILVGSPGAD